MIKKAEWLSISGDRTVVIMLIVLGVITLIAVVSSLLRIHFSDVQIPSRYSVYGTTNIYREQWYMLYMFPLFALLVSFTNGYLALKTHSINRLVSVGVLGVSLIVAVTCLIVSHAVFNLAPTV